MWLHCQSGISCSSHQTRTTTCLQSLLSLMVSMENCYELGNFFLILKGWQDKVTSFLDNTEINMWSKKNLQCHNLKYIYNNLKCARSIVIWCVLLLCNNKSTCYTISRLISIILPLPFSVIGYVIYRGSNSQKDLIRRDPHSPALAREYWV